MSMATYPGIYQIFKSGNVFLLNWSHFSGIKFSRYENENVIEELVNIEKLLKMERNKE